MSSQFLVVLNQTYITTHSLVEKGTVYETKFLKAIDELKKSEELRKKLAEEVKVVGGAKATLEEKLAKIKAKNTELQNQLQGNQEDLQTVQRNYTTMCGKVIGLEKEVKATEDRHHEVAKHETTSRETTY